MPPSVRLRDWTMILDELDFPVVLAPLAGGPSTPALAAAVSGAGGLGFLAAGYLTGDEMIQRLRAARALVAGPFGVNLFCPGSGPASPAVYETYLARLRSWVRERELELELGTPRYSDDDWAVKLELLRSDPAQVVSFTFGCPDPTVVETMHAAGSEVWVTVTTPEEAGLADEAGADVLVVQGGEAGGHRGSFTDDPGVPVYGLLALIELVHDRVRLPLVAAGGVASGRALAAVLAAGARAAQIGTAFMLAPEAGTSAAHRVALRSNRPTALTRAFTGRLARGIRNGFMDELGADAPIAYPEIHYVTAPIRAHARQIGSDDLINLWAGESHTLAVERPAADTVHALANEARMAAEVLRHLLD